MTDGSIPARAGRVLSFAIAALLVVCCTWAGPGAWQVALRHYGVPLGLIWAAILFAPRAPRCVVRLAGDGSGLLAFMLFILLVGAGGMISHGTHFAGMARDFWHADVLVAPDRRPVLPAIAWLLPPWPAPYIALWYATFCITFLAAWAHLSARGLPPVARFALLTAGILAYLAIIPGYTEALTYLVALLCWQTELTAAEKCVAAALMIGGHEIAGGFAVAFLAIEADGTERRDWVAVLALLYAAYALGYVLAAGAGVWHALGTATRPDARYPLSALQLVMLHPAQCLLGIAAAYKVAWLLLPSGFFDTARTRLHAACVLLALPLVLVATDTSRVVQFGSLSMLAVAAALWPRLPQRALVGGLLVLPSICVWSNGGPGWGNGLYALYVLAGERAGLNLGILLR